MNKNDNKEKTMKKTDRLSKALAAAGRAISAVVKAVKSVVRSFRGLFTRKPDDNAAALMLLCAGAGAIIGLILTFPTEGVSLAFALVGGVAGKGVHAVDDPLTTGLAESASPGLLRNEIDERIIKIRPMSTPLDQISRYGGSRLCGAMKVDYYSVDTRPIQDTVSEDFSAGRTPASGAVSVKVAHPAVFDPSTTLLVPSVKVAGGGSLVLYVVSRENDAIKVMAVNNPDETSGESYVPDLPAGTVLVRMGRAAAELDVMTAQYEALPKKETNFCQIFKTQVEQSTFMKIANKEVGWTFSDQEEAAIIDMRMGMEKNFLFGHKGTVTDPDKNDDILLTGGIWNQTPNTFEYSELSTEADLVGLCRQAFTNNAGSSRKVLIGGTGLIERLHKIDHSRVLTADQTTTRWGLDFTEIHSKFGTLYVLLSEVFDQCGMPDGGMIIDPEYITKYCHVPFRTERLNLRAAGVRNTDAIVITEASCLVLRYPQSHLRIVRKPASTTA